MPAADPNIDWNSALALYCQRLTTPEIAKQIGCNLATLKSRIIRERWMDKRERTNLAIVATNQDRAQNDLRRAGERTRGTIAIASESLANSLAERKLPKSLESQNLFADTLAKTAKTAALVHGWEKTTINAVVMAGDTTEAIESLCNEPIDVESTSPQL